MSNPINIRRRLSWDGSRQIRRDGVGRNAQQSVLEVALIALTNA